MRFSFLQPVMAPLMRQRLLCRMLLLATLVLGIAAWRGWSIWPCIFAEITQRPCPGCGMTRSFMALLRGNWAESLRMHPFTIFFVMSGLMCSVVTLLPLGLAERIVVKVEVFERKTKLPAAALILFASFGLLRMLGLWYQPPLPERPWTFRRPEVVAGTINHNSQHIRNLL